MVVNKHIVEKIVYALILIFIVINAIYRQDSIASVISAICGITYTIYAGKGRPFCYLFGVCGSGFYGFLAWQSALWGNLLLYVGYYIPMQIFGFFNWNNNLKKDKNEIVKIRLPRKELGILLLFSFVSIVILTLFLIYFRDKHPILDSITTVLSLGGMYLTVRRAIEQWLFWIAVNALSLVMWINVAIGGGKVWATVIMWAVYLFLGFYFYFEWRKELQSEIRAKV